MKVARGTVQNRLARLERDGTIAGYTIRLRPAVDEHRISAFTTIAVEGTRIEPVVRMLRGDPAIVTLYTTNGRWDLVAEIRTDSLQSFDQVLSRIRRIDGISGTGPACCCPRTSSEAGRPAHSPELLHCGN